VDEKSVMMHDDKSAEAREISVSTPTETSSITPGKYVPPMKRQNQTQRDKITRSLKGLLNRLSEGNMHAISTQVMITIKNMIFLKLCLYYNFTFHFNRLKNSTWPTVGMK